MEREIRTSYLIIPTVDISTEQSIIKINRDERYLLADMNGIICKGIKGSTLLGYIRTQKYSFTNLNNKGSFVKIDGLPKKSINIGFNNISNSEIRFNDGLVKYSNYNNGELMTLKKTKDHLIIYTSIPDYKVDIKHVRSTDSKESILAGLSGGDSVIVGYNGKIVGNFIGWQGSIENITIAYDRNSKRLKIWISYDNMDNNSRESKLIRLEM